MTGEALLAYLVASSLKVSLIHSFNMPALTSFYRDTKDPNSNHALTPKNNKKQ